jgi:ATP-binding cassette subfamily B protein
MWQTLKRFFGEYISPQKGKFTVVQILHVMAALVLLIPPLVIRYVIDDAVPEKSMTGLMTATLFIIFLYVLWAVMAGAKEYWGHELAQGVTSRLRNDLYNHFQKLSMSFHDRKKTGELLSRLVDDMNVIQEVSHHGPETILMAIVMVTGTSTILIWLNWRLALAALVILPIMLVYTRATVHRMWSQFRVVRKQKANLSNVLEENLSGIHVIKAYTSEDREAESVSKANDEVYRSRMSVIKWMAFLFPGAMFLNGAAIAVVVFYGGWMTMNGMMKVGTLAAFILLLQRFIQPIMRMMMAAEQGGRFFAGIERFFEYIDIEPDVMDSPQAKVMEKIEGEVRFEDVWFRYDSTAVLQSVNLCAKPGEMIALVGPSGAGKTTITRLIPRFYEPYKGKVFIDGVEVRDINIRSLRSHIGMVMQDDYLFSGTVADNIRYGRPGAVMDDILASAEGANAVEFIERLPEKYNSEIGKRGIKLSEGQKQRISIARALLKNPKILLLDEATSSVDTETERLIQQAIERLRKGRTTFVIAHRLSTILEADQILFIQDGSILERGTHEDLMQLNGQYARFYRIQFNGGKGGETIEW